MTEGDIAHLLAHQRNIGRYVRLLRRRRLTDHERQYIERRLAEECAIIKSFPEGFASSDQTEGSRGRRRKLVDPQRIQTEPELWMSSPEGSGLRTKNSGLDSATRSRLSIRKRNVMKQNNR
jgi:hypothetical protein